MLQLKLPYHEPTQGVKLYKSNSKLSPVELSYICYKSQVTADSQPTGTCVLLCPLPVSINQTRSIGTPAASSLSTDITNINRASQATVDQYWPASVERTILLVIGCNGHLLHISQKQVNQVNSHHLPLLGAAYLPPQPHFLSVLSDPRASRPSCPSLAY